MTATTTTPKENPASGCYAAAGQGNPHCQELDSVNSGIVRFDADRINQLHAGISAALKNTLADAMEIGRLLAEVKASMPHGSFTAWLADNVQFTDRTARRYLSLHENRDRIKTDTVSDLTGAYRLLAEPRDESSLSAKEKRSLSEHEAAIQRGLDCARAGGYEHLLLAYMAQIGGVQ